MYNLKYILISIILIGFINLGFSQQRKPYIENFTPKNYGLSNHAQNWSVVQGDDGILYFGNSTKVLEYDGQNWKDIKITPNGFIVSMAKAPNNRIYVGSVNEFGYIDIDEKGEKKYYSLSNNLKEEDKYFDKVWRVFYTDEAVYFFSQKQIYVYADNKISLIKPTINGTTFHTAFMVGNKLIVRQRGLGLLMYNNNNNLELIDGGNVFKNMGVFGIIPFKDKYLIITQEIGLYEYSLQNKLITKLQIADENKLNSYMIYGAIKLHNNKIALNTSKNGVVIIDSIGNIKQIFNEKTGIIDNGVNAIYQDFYNDLWLATMNGISRINYSSPVSFYNEETGLYGNVYTSVRYNGKLYVGTTNGLFVQASENSNRFFKRIKGLKYNVTDLTVAHSNLLIGTKEGLYNLSKTGELSLINNLDSRNVLWVKEKELLFTVGKNGLAIYEYINKWRQIKINEEIIDDFIGFDYELIDGKIRLWTGSQNSGVFKIDIDDKLNIGYYLFIAESGLDDGWVRLFKYNNKVYFSQRSGVYEYLTADKVKEQVDDSLKQYIINGEFVRFSGIKIKEGLGIFNIEQQRNEIFANVENEIMYGKTTDSLSNRRFKLIDYQVYNNLYLEKDTTLWLCSNNGLLAYDLLNSYNIDAKPVLYNRQVKCSVDSVLFNGNNNGLYKIDYDYNTLTFDYSSLYLQNGIASVYSYKLEGYDDDWSEWTKQTNVRFSKLYEGKYTFKVKAKTIYGVESDIVSFNFEVLRPWYRSIGAYILYFIIIILVIVVVIRLYTARLKAQNIQLEKIVQERTAEVVKQKDEIEKQKDKITHIHNEVKDSINYAERIQKAVLPSKDFIDEALDEHFILFKPKDVVSGDYYWAFRVKDILIITVADCTGHGVPGAFMSMLGISFLNEIVSNDGVTTASQILDELREKVIFALKQKGIEGEQKDGMDMSICVIDLKTNIVQWAGANNPLYILSDTEIEVQTDNTSYKIFEDKKLTVTDKILYEIKPDKMPVAHYIKMDNFANNVFKLKKGDRLYMFSDGYADQFGGPKGKKYKYKPFKRLIVNSSNKLMEEQNVIFDKSIEEWMSYTDEVTGKNYEQIDDICLIGIKL